MILAGLYEHNKVFNSPFRSFIQQFLCKIDVFEVAAESDDGKVYGVLLRRECVVQDIVKTGVVDVEFVIALVGGEGGQREICVRVVSLSLLLVAVIGMVEVLVVLGGVFVKDVIVHLFELRPALSLGDELVVRDGGEEDLPVRLPEAYHRDVDVHARARLRRGIVSCSSFIKRAKGYFSTKFIATF